MQKFKFNFQFLALVAIVAFAFASSAFTAPKAGVTTGWFMYDGSGDIEDPESYVLYTPGEPGCDAERQLCSIQAEIDGVNPVITPALVSEIEDALDDHTNPHSNVKLLAF